MAAITLQSNTLPTAPNYSIAAYNTDSMPEAFGYQEASSDVVTENPEQQMALVAAYDSLHTAQIPVNVKTIVDDGVSLQVTIDQPVMLDPATETHSGYAKWKFGTPTVSNTAADGTIITVITRFLRRLSKLNRGAN